MNTENLSTNIEEYLLEDLTCKDDSLHNAINNLSLNDFTLTKDKCSDTDNVYLSNILNLIENIHLRFDKMEITKMSFDSMRYHYIEIYKMLCQGKTQKAKEYIKTMCNNFVDDRILQVEKEYKDHKYDELRFYMKKCLEVIIGKHSECVEAVHTLQKKSNDLETNQNEAMHILNKLKQFLGTENVVERIDEIAKTNNMLEIENSKLQGKLKNIIKENNSKDTKELQEQNIKLQDEVVKFTEKNHKLKKECVIFSNEIGTMKEENRRLQKTIEKQKKIMKAMQMKIGSSFIQFEFPIDELKEKIQKLRLCIQNEQNEITKSEKINEMLDCEKRLNDFLRFQERGNR